MSQFYFYENCTFCQSRTGSTHCLLPYQLVRDYIPPKEDVSRIVDITEIHMLYGIESLNANLQSINWIRDRPYSRQESNLSMTSNVKATDWFEQMKEQGMSNKQVSTDPTSVTDDDVESNYSDYISDQLDEGALLTTEAEMATMSISRPSYAEASASTTVSVDHKDPVIAKVHEEKSSVKGLSILERYQVELSKANKDHLIRDLVIIAKAAFNIHSAQRGWIKTSALKESLMHESGIRSMTGIKYQPSKNTSLDGDKALSKELVAVHSQKEIQDWESGKFTEGGQYCILNALQFSLKTDDLSANRLIRDLVTCFVDTLKMQTRKKGVRDSFTEPIKFDLIKTGHPTTFDWISNKYTYYKNGGAEPSPPRSVTSDGPSRVKKTKEPYSYVDQRTLDLINIHLQVLVNKRIEMAGEDVPTMSDETKLSKFLYKLASEFLMRNKGWLNDNSFTVPQHLTKLEETTGLKTKPTESFSTFSLLKGIIEDARIAFRERHPKMKFEK